MASPVGRRLVVPANLKDRVVMANSCSPRIAMATGGSAIDPAIVVLAYLADTADGPPPAAGQTQEPDRTTIEMVDID